MYVMDKHGNAIYLLLKITLNHLVKIARIALFKLFINLKTYLFLLENLLVL